MHWHADKPTELITQYTSDTNYYHCIDYSHDEGSKIACAGQLPIIELFDDVTMKKIDFIDEVDKIGHTNKIFCLKFDHRHPSVLYSGGWDRNVNIWDIRAGGKEVGTIYGPMIGGDAIDVDSKHHVLVTGSMIEDDGV